MERSVSFGDDSKLASILKNIPAGAHCVVEGGHLTARVRHLTRSSGRRRLGGHKDQSYLVEVTDHPDPLPCEILRGPIEEDHQSQWAIVRPRLDELIDLPGQLTSTEHIYTIKYQPSETQRRSLALALDIAHRLASNVKRVRLAILIGDLGIPPSLRGSLKWVLPEAYKTMLSDAGVYDDVHIYSEAACRNQGKRRLLDPQKSVFENCAKAEQIYKEQGYTLFRDPLSGSLSLRSDYALQKLREFPHQVAVTKDAATPTCGLILAGKLLSIAREGFTHFLSVYDEADDARIRRKNIDGFIIFAHMAYNTRLDAVLCTSNTVGHVKHPPKLDEFSSDEIKSAGQLSGIQELYELTYQRNLDPGPEFIDAMSSRSCCTYSPTRSHHENNIEET